MTSKLRWQSRLFGPRLSRCHPLPTGAASTPSTPPTPDSNQVDTQEALRPCEVTAIYFSFANISAAEEVTRVLLGLYNRLNGGAVSEGSPRRLEVVQVVLWANNDVYGDFEQSYKDSISGLPWFAVPFGEIELKTRLGRRYRIKVGVPTLVLLDSEGGTITCSGKERLLEDPHGDGFPWRPRPVDQVLKDIRLQPGRLYGSAHADDGQTDIRYQDLPDCIRGFYFSAHWCPPCRAFTPQLVDTYRLLRKKEPGFEVVFVSSDRSGESYETYLEGMPWVAVPWQQSAVRAELAQLYGVRGIPTLLLVDTNGHVVSHDARTELMEDPLAQNFPWKPRPVNILTERYATKLHDYPAVVLFIEGEDSELHFAESVLSPAADTYYKKYNINFNAPQEEFLYACEDEHYIQFLIGLDSDTSDILRDLVGLDDLVPLLVGLDIPNNKFAVMDYGQEISVDSVQDFVERFQKGNLEFRDINERLPDSNEETNENT